MNEHTTGPWKAVYVGCSDWDLIGPVTEQDWKLAAAAPELLDALMSIAKNTCCDRCQEAALVARSAIAKATGGQP